MLRSPRLKSGLVSPPPKGRDGSFFFETNYDDSSRPTTAATTAVAPKNPQKFNKISDGL